MALTSGREIAENGIPHREAITLLALGEPWLDQQWLSQLAWYGVEQAGTLAGVALFDVLLVAGAYASALAAARMLGASARAAVLVALPCLVMAPWSWQVRAQTFALPLFVWTLFLAAQHVRKPSRRIWLAVPLLLVWANLHGSVLLGATMVILAALWAAAATPHRWTALPGAAVFAVVAAVAALTTPYGLDIVDYYRLLLFDPPFGDYVVEWGRTKLEPITAVFFAVAALGAVLVVWKRRRLAWFDIAVLVILFVGALQAVRGIAWFALGVAVLLPNALDGVFRSPAVVKYPRVNLAIAGISAAAAAVAIGVIAAKPSDWFEARWPSGAITAVEAAGPEARVFPSDRHANWLLWHDPELRGRLAFDTRFELLSKQTFRSLLYWNSQVGDDWRRIANGYSVLVIDEPRRHKRFAQLAAVPGARVAYLDDKVAVIVRSKTRG
jgi:hypothetical protein